MSQPKPGPEISDVLLAAIEPFRVTTKGANPWTAEAARNVVERLAYYRAALDAVGGRLDSCFRTPRVNKLVGGSQNSLHLDGLACDIAPPADTCTPRRAVGILWAMVLDGRLGDVHEVILEPTWVHVGWRRAHMPPGAKLLRKLPTMGYEPLTL
jgi:hypothetical protein